MAGTSEPSGNVNDFEACFLEAAQLVEEEVAQGHINGGDVSEFWHLQILG